MAAPSRLLLLMTGTDPGVVFTDTWVCSRAKGCIGYQGRPVELHTFEQPLGSSGPFSGFPKRFYGSHPDA
ncbi:MAG: hypothetical protein ACKO5M_03925, partial [Vulcanococcus sp.]